MAKTKREYLKSGDRAWAECYIVWNEEKKCFVFDGIAEEAYYDGEPLNFDKNNRAYIDREVK